MLLFSSIFLNCRCQTIITQEDMYSHVLSMFVENKVNVLLLFLTCSSMLSYLQYKFLVPYYGHTS